MYAVGAPVALGLLTAALACSIEPDSGMPFGGGPMAPTPDDETDTDGDQATEGDPATTDDGGAATGNDTTTAEHTGDGSTGELGSSTGSVGPTGDGGFTGTGSTGTTTNAIPTGTGEPPLAGGSCSGLTQFVAPIVTAPELHVFGVYEAQAGSAITVSIDRAGVPLTIVLSSYESVTWTLDLAPGVIVDEVMLNGYEPQSVQGHGAAPVSDRSGAGRYVTACGYHWPGNGGGCETQQLVSGVEALTGLELTTFTGCYAGTTFSLQ